MSAAPTPAPVAACAPTSGTPQGKAASVLTVLENERKSDALNAVIFNGSIGAKPFLTTAIGNSTPGVPASTAMHFRLGMPSESLQILLMLQLVDQGRLSLNDPVSKWYPAYPYATAATVRMLAASSAGFGDYVYGPGHPARGIPSFPSLVDNHPYREFSSAELIRRSQAPFQDPKFDDPGKNWDYSHTNYVVLGTILEKVTHTGYDALLQSAIVKPLGLHDTAFSIEPAIQPPVLHAFTADRGRYEDSTGYSPSWTSFSGAVNSNICDLLALNEAFGTGSLLTPASYAQIAAPVNVGLGKNTPPLYFGLGTIVNHGWLVTSGNYYGWHTAMAYYPRSHTAFAFTLTEGPTTKNASKINNALLEAVSRVLVPASPIVFPK
jgi:D-alanyl-D-alanine carboxypeptidase